MKKILFSLGTMIVVAVMAVGSTGAFLSDTELSTGNVFAAGTIDLKIDNESYYNGNVSTSTSWQLSDLSNGLLFFDFRDLKPDDEGEDTISLHVDNNDAYLCMDMTLTSNDDISSNEPELNTEDAPEDVNNTWDGELAGLLNMFWWADDGDNVYEIGEQTISGGVKSLQILATTTPYSVALADTSNNVWTPEAPGAILGGQTKYIAKAWCYGTLTTQGVTQDGIGHLPDASNGPLTRGTGVQCDGKTLGDESQTDGVTVDVAFRALQSRNNPNFFCGGQDPRLAKLTVIKQIINDNGGNNIISDFQLQVVGTVVTNVTSGATTTLAAGNYAVTETGIAGYQASFTGDCNAAGQITLNPGDEKTCTITNNDISPNITLIKNVINNDGGTAVAANFTMKIDGGVVPQNTSVAVSANSAHVIDENPVAGYHFVSLTGVGCPVAMGAPVVLNEGQAITCTITNNDDGTSDGPAEVNLLSADGFVIVAKTAITDATPAGSVITGNVAINPAAGSAITDVSCSTVGGTIYSSGGYTGGFDSDTTCAATDPVTALAVRSAMETAYADAAGRTGPDATELGAGDIGGMVLAPGLYKWSTGVTIPTDVTLSGDANDVWIFQIGGTLNIASGGSPSGGADVVLSGGALAKNVFWQVAGATTLGAYSTFNGTILAQTNIAIQTGAVLNGRALAQTAVTLDDNTVTLP